jgi:hypothetical protein
MKYEEVVFDLFEGTAFGTGRTLPYFFYISGQKKK